MTALTIDDLVEAWITKSRYPNGPVHHYWSTRFDLLCSELSIDIAGFDDDQRDLWHHGDYIADFAGHKFGAGILEVPSAVGTFTRRWNQRWRAAESDFDRVLHEMLRDCVVTVVPDAVARSTTMKRLVDLGLDDLQPDPIDFI